MDYENIKKIIESCHLNFLIGSGASKPFLETLYNVERLLTDLTNDTALDIDQNIILEASIKYFYFKKCVEGNLNIVEDATPAETTQKNYDDWLTSLYTILVKRRSNLVSKQINLFTTNMDIFFDWSLEKNQFSYNDGFFGRMNPVFGTGNFHNTIKKTSTHYEYQSEVPLFNLFKLHGSVNWRSDDNKIYYDPGLSILKSISDVLIEDNDLLIIEEEIKGEPKRYGLKELKNQLSHKKLVKKKEHEQFLVAYQDLVMINPTKQKFETTTKDLTFYELLRMYSNHLERENSVLFVIGFSFADEHIREITKRVALSNPTLQIIIFAFNETAKNEIESNLGSKSNIKYMVGKVDESYTLKKINEQYFARLSKELENAKDLSTVESKEETAEKTAND